jgi:pimeloyl-ACP methyl ester carboxylesterase
MMRIRLLAGLLTFAPLAFAQADPLPALSLKPCRLEHPARIQALPAECASFTVPENYDEPNGRTIELFVARVPAISLNEAKDPLFLLAGGPGGSAVDLYTAAAAAFERVRRDRDIILVDQRGTGRSHRLDCPGMDADLFQKFSEIEVGPEANRCRDELLETSDLRQFTTSVAVRDLDAVRRALGYARINLYGQSYGTRVAQHFARRYPEVTRTLILDGVVDPATVLGPATAVDAERALERILERCANDTACAQAFKDPFGDYRALRTKLATNPPRVTINDASGKPLEFEFTGRHLSAVLRFASYNDDQAALLPLSLHLAAHENNYVPLANQFRVFARTLDEAFAYGMHNSVACSEDIPLIESGKLDRAALEATHMGPEMVEQLMAACRDWPRGVVDADLHAPLQSKAAALLLSGADDPVTPPEYATVAQKAFPDSKHVIVAGHGHGQLIAPCVDRIIASFVAAGTAKNLDTSCTQKLKPMPFFITLSGPAP